MHPTFKLHIPAYPYLSPAVIGRQAVDNLVRGTQRNMSTHGRGEHANSMEKGPIGQDLDPGPFCCRATVLITSPPCSLNDPTINFISLLLQTWVIAFHTSSFSASCNE
ncbi:hypothetical protein XENOCAPTIV_018567 [Xenoophorus captivus]|uniref:Uncharacterized protein n=1 Tax=Xenoophorus captivus TaxID=1517983 RepID=A0ABV0QAL2_9TELE